MTDRQSALGSFASSRCQTCIAIYARKTSTVRHHTHSTQRPHLPDDEFRRLDLVAAWKTDARWKSAQIDEWEAREHEHEHEREWE